MRKWEEKYEELKSGKLDTIISELQRKFDNKNIKREELKELEKAKRIKENMQKIENVVEYKEKLEDQLKKLKAEQDRRKSLIDLSKETKRLDDELSVLERKKAVAQKKLKTSNLSDDQKKEIEEMLTELKSKISKNQEAFSRNQLAIAATSKAGGKLAELPQEELQARITSIGSKISKCNMICGKLIEGYSWESIDMKLEQWQDRKLTSKKETADKMRAAANVDKKERTKRAATQEKGTTREDSKGKTGRNDSEGSKGKEKTEKGGSLVEVSEFDRKHPKLAKIKSFFKKMGQKIKDTFTDEEVSQEKTPEVKAKEEADDFRSYIKVVADKGIKQADKERLAAKKEALKQKLAEQNGRDQEER